MVHSECVVAGRNLRTFLQPDCRVWTIESLCKNMKKHVQETFMTCDEISNPCPSKPSRKFELMQKVGPGRPGRLGRAGIDPCIVQAAGIYIPNLLDLFGQMMVSLIPRLFGVGHPWVEDKLKVGDKMITTVFQWFQSLYYFFLAHNIWSQRS